ncbi:hypothetical protein GSI_02596 [Ganoderma sinense ZZ0214-1]|uniref:Uncharacterized protein n=1 Tax=Ganoderma sinense ZZ0214-1 TaxID=1077348 RepID=A0A2G8SM39_9APHY|nr:hypothetical protein GSI_02596 [Ganoderma sinense ZZ0214-1]
MEGHAPPNVKAALELAASLVMQQRDANLFINDNQLPSVQISANPVIRLQKTGGTTSHREQGRNYLHYNLSIPSVEVEYSIYVARASTRAEVNRETLARAIAYFIYNYDNGSTFTHEEAAT